MLTPDATTTVEQTKWGVQRDEAMAKTIVTNATWTLENTPPTEEPLQGPRAA